MKKVILFSLSVITVSSLLCMYGPLDDKPVQHALLHWDFITTAQLPQLFDHNQRSLLKKYDETTPYNQLMHNIVRFSASFSYIKLQGQHVFINAALLSSWEKDTYNYSRNLELVYDHLRKAKNPELLMARACELCAENLCTDNTTTNDKKLETLIMVINTSLSRWSHSVLQQAPDNDVQKELITLHPEQFRGSFVQDKPLDALAHIEHKVLNCAQTLKTAALQTYRLPGHLEWDKAKQLEQLTYNMQHCAKNIAALREFLSTADDMQAHIEHALLLFDTTNKNTQAFDELVLTTHICRHVLLNSIISRASKKCLDILVDGNFPDTNLCHDELAQLQNT